VEDFGVGVGGAGGGDGGVAFFDFEEAEELGGVDDGEQVVDFEGEVVGEAVDVVAAAFVDEQFEQAGDAAGAGVGQHLVVHLALVADGLAGGLVGGGGDDFGPGEDFVDVVDEVGEGLGFAVARVGELDLEVGADVAGIAAEDDDAVGEQDGFFDVVGDEEDGLGGHGFVGPELEEFGAEVFGGEDVEGGEGLVHEEDFGLDDEGAGEADALAHAAGELFGEGGLEAVEADGVEHAEAAFAAGFGVDAAGLERGFDVFEDGEPGEEREALEDDGDVDFGVGDGLFMPVDLAGAGLGEAGEHAQHGGFAGAGGAEEGENFAGDDGEVGGGDDLDAVLAGLGVVLLDLLGANDRARAGEVGGGVRVGRVRTDGGGFLHRASLQKWHAKVDLTVASTRFVVSLLQAGCSSDELLPDSRS
jgi:hypothetical protein